MVKILKDIPGISNVFLLNEEQKKKVLELEEERNIGVLECVKREKCYFCTHDSSFREPDSKIVLVEGDKIVFPAVSFHEIVGAISSSPSKKVHEFLVEEFNLDLEDEASLLVGVDRNE